MIDVDKLYAKYQGQTLDYDGVAADAGQCVQWVEYALTDTQYGYGLQPFWGNAIDWWNNYGGSLLAFDKITDGSIKKGDIVIFNTLVGSQYGHIDVAAADGTTADFQGYDSNWGGNKTVHPVHHVGAQYVLGSLRLKGEDMEVFKDTNDVRVNGYGLFGIDVAGDSPALLRAVGTSKLEFFKGLGPQVQNNLKAQDKIIADLQKGYTPVTETLYRKS